MLNLFLRRRRRRSGTFDSRMPRIRSVGVCGHTPRRLTPPGGVSAAEEVRGRAAGMGGSVIISVGSWITGENGSRIRRAGVDRHAAGAVLRFGTRTDRGNAIERRSRARIFDPRRFSTAPTWPPLGVKGRSFAAALKGASGRRSASSVCGKLQRGMVLGGIAQERKSPGGKFQGASRVRREARETQGGIEAGGGVQASIVRLSYRIGYEAVRISSAVDGRGDGTRRPTGPRMIYLAGAPC